MDQHGGTADRCRLLAARLQAAVRDRRARERDERGSMLVEALVGMAMITIVVAGFMGVSNGVQDSIRHHESVDAVDQYLTGLAEETAALSWGSVAHCGNNTGDLVTNAKWPAGSCPAVTLPRTRTENIDGVNITITTQVEWVGMSGASPDDYGQKRVTMRASWMAGGRTRNATETYFRTATPSEALPVAIPRIS